MQGTCSFLTTSNLKFLTTSNLKFMYPIQIQVLLRSWWIFHLLWNLSHSTCICKSKGWNKISCGSWSNMKFAFIFISYSKQIERRISIKVVYQKSLKALFKAPLQSSSPSSSSSSLLLLPTMREQSNAVYHYCSK